MTENVMNGTDLALYVGTADGSEVLVARATECSISLSEDARDITTKDSGGWRELLEGLRSFSISSSHLHAEDDSQNVADLISSYMNREKIFVLFSTEESGDYRFNGEARIASLEVNAGVEDNVSYSVSLEGTGALVYEAIA